MSDPMAQMDLIRKLTHSKMVREIRTLDVGTISQSDAEQLLDDIMAGSWRVEENNPSTMIISRPYIRSSAEVRMMLGGGETRAELEARIREQCANDESFRNGEDDV